MSGADSRGRRKSSCPECRGLGPHAKATGIQVGDEDVRVVILKLGGGYSVAEELIPS